MVMTDLERVRLSVEDVKVLAVVVRLPDAVWGVDEVTVLEDFSEPEGFLEVHESATAWSVDVVDRGEA